jgi:hypothetical protein
MEETKKKKMFAINREQRKLRRQTERRGVRTHGTINNGQKIELKKVVAMSPEQAESRQIVVEMTRSFINTVEFYKSDWGGAKPHDEAVKQSLQMNEWRRSYVEGLEPEKVDWGHIAAVGEASMQDSLLLWSRLIESAEDELESGRRSAQVAGARTEPYELAQFLAIRNSFADQWQPNGGIEAAMIDMMAIAFSLQMYWTTIAHQRAIRTHNDQQTELDRYENKGWKSPYQYEADAIDQAHKLADSYNRQFLRVLRQLRDLRRYSSVIIQNNGGQVNVGAQQVNVQQSKE